MILTVFYGLFYLGSDLLNISTARAGHNNIIVMDFKCYSLKLWIGGLLMLFSLHGHVLRTFVLNFVILWNTLTLRR